VSFTDLYLFYSGTQKLFVHNGEWIEYLDIKNTPENQFSLFVSIC